VYNHGLGLVEPVPTSPFAGKLFWYELLIAVSWSKPRELNRTDRELHGLSPVQTARTNAVAAAFQHAWNGYFKYCFGHDTLHPVTNTCEDDFGGYGATAINSLPTAINFRNENVTFQILEFIAALDVKVVKGGTRIQVFEVTIRHFAAMISAWDLLHGPFSHMAKSPDLRHALYTQMVALGGILSCAFDSPSGIPREWVDPASCHPDQGTQNTIAGIGTVILEFARLSDITGDRKYADLAEKAENHLLKTQPASGEPYTGLLGSFINVGTREIIGSQGSWGALTDCKIRLTSSLICWLTIHSFLWILD
jgi:mannosyl-oligosaccharide alpha-1,2-mannosidase